MERIRALAQARCWLPAPAVYVQAMSAIFGTMADQARRLPGSGHAERQGWERIADVRGAGPVEALTFDLRVIWIRRYRLDATMFARTLTKQRL